MKKMNFFLLVLFLLIIPLTNCSVAGDENSNNESEEIGGTDNYLIADHTSVDLSSIPDTWIEKVKEIIEVHYCHTSHGGQITIGLERLMNGNFADSVLSATYNFYADNCNMPDTDEYFSMMEGQFTEGYCETYITPDLYWQGDTAISLTKNMLNGHNINVSLFAWCTQLDYYSSSTVEDYLKAMSDLEDEFPNVTFIYMTGNAQSQEQNRYDRNEQIRKYCRDNKKILFDFADLDCWYNGDKNVENGIPMEHPHYNGDQAAHTTYESCENKAKAFWWLMARISGWDGK